MSSTVAAGTAAAPLNSYDEVPYPSHAFPQTHPARLATVASLFGLRPARVNHCRVLELGSASGGNLIPMAEAWPESTFLGVDLSHRQVEAAEQTIAALGLKNIEIKHQSITDITPELGKFDYIVCHGVYSWVPTEVQEKILEICNDNLAPQGVAYVSYNTYPGWRMRGMIRDMMCYHANRFRTPTERIGQARGLLEFLSNSISRENNAYGILLKNELDMLLKASDSYLFHDYLEEINEPLYFHQFIERANAKKLQYLGEAVVGHMSSSNFGPDIEKTLRMVATGVIQMEQYMDFLRNRTFRQTLLCHQGLALARNLGPEHSKRCLIAGNVRAENPTADPRVPGSEKLTGMNAVTVTTPDPLAKAALLHLGRIWPRAIAFDELAAAVGERLTPDGQPPTKLPPESVHNLAVTMMQCFAATMIEFQLQQHPFVSTVGERPVASPYARLQAASMNGVTSRRHETVVLENFDRFILPLLDGEHDRQALMQAVLKGMEEGRVTLTDSTALEDSQVRKILDEGLDRGLSRIAGGGLLVG